MVTTSQQLEDNQRDNRDSHMSRARRLKEKGLDVQVKHHVSLARIINHNLVRIKRETRH